MAMNDAIQQIIDVIDHDPAVENVIGFTGASGGPSNAATNTGSLFVALKPLDERKDRRDEDHRSAAPAAQPPARRVGVPPGRAGPAHRRPVEQRACTSTRSRATACEDAREVGAHDPAGDEGLARPSRRELGPAERRPRRAARPTIASPPRSSARPRRRSTRSSTTPSVRPRCRIIYTQANQYYVVLEAAPQFLLRPRGPEVHLPAVFTSSDGCESRGSGADRIGGCRERHRPWRRRCPAARDGDLPRGHDAAGREPHELVPVGHGLLQPRDERVPERRDEARSTRCERASARRRTCGASSPARCWPTSSPSAPSPCWSLIALLAVYIVLGILYESLVHPLTIISTLPSASVGAMLALIALPRRI